MLSFLQWNSFPEREEEVAEGDISVTDEKTLYVNQMYSQYSPHEKRAVT